jgi:hypothetical protein
MVHHKRWPPVADTAKQWVGKVSAAVVIRPAVHYQANNYDNNKQYGQLEKNKSLYGDCIWLLLDNRFNNEGCSY